MTEFTIREYYIIPILLLLNGFRPNHCTLRPPSGTLTYEMPLSELRSRVMSICCAAAEA